jgi:hypothetical protein
MMPMDWRQGADRPRRARGWAPRKVFTVAPSGSHHVHALTEATWGCWTHYREIPGCTRRTFLCTGEMCECKRTKGMNKTWVGYLAVVDATLQNPAIFKVSVAADACLDQIRAKHGSIMDVRLKIYRKPKFGKVPKRNDEVVVEADGPGVGEKVRPPAFDVRPTVLLMFGYEPETIDEMLGY